MKQCTAIKEVVYLGRNYRYTYHFGSGLIEIEEMEYVGWIFKTWEYRRVYRGHDTPIREALAFNDEQRKTDTFLNGTK